jgi:hypothetical protein
MQTPAARQFFNPDELALLRGCFDRVWQELSPDTTAQNCDLVRAEIAKAITNLASDGQLDPMILEIYAKDRGTRAVHGRLVKRYARSR